MTRVQISKRARFEIFKRDGFICQYCGATPPDVVLHVDHIIPVAEGGQNEPDNLTTSCADCNLGKGSRTLDQVPQSLQDQAEEAKERRAQVEAYAKLLQEARESFEEWCWEIAEILKHGASNGYSRPQFRSIKMFVNRIGFGRVREAAVIAADKYPEGTRRFKYFCGVCWRMTREVEGQDD
jgi:hypothetical protein